MCFDDPGRGKLSIATQRLEQALSGLSPWPEGDEGTQESSTGKRGSDKRDVTVKEGAVALRRKKEADGKRVIGGFPTKEERCRTPFELDGTVCDRVPSLNPIHSLTGAGTVPPAWRSSKSTSPAACGRAAQRRELNPQAAARNPPS